MSTEPGAGPEYLPDRGKSPCGFDHADIREQAVAEARRELLAAVNAINRLVALPSQDVATFQATRARLLAVLDRLIDATPTRDAQPAEPVYQLSLSSEDDPRTDAEIRRFFFDYIDTAAPHETPVLTTMGDLRVLPRILGSRGPEEPREGVAGSAPRWGDGEEGEAAVKADFDAEVEDCTFVSREDLLRQAAPDGYEYHRHANGEWCLRRTPTRDVQSAEERLRAIETAARRVLAFADEAVSDDDGSVYWDNLDPIFTDLLSILRAALATADTGAPEESGS